MKQDIKAQWVAALRSGQYAQGTEMLADLEGGAPTFCCLGVLCMLYGSSIDSIADRSYPPREVVEWAGLGSQSPDVLFDGEMVGLDALNDQHRLSFPQIADIIERQL